MVLNRNVMEPIVKNIPEFKIFDFCAVRTLSFHPGDFGGGLVQEGG